MHCNANSSASSASHHTLFMQRQEQATSERLWLALGHYSKRQHLEPHFSVVFDLFFFTIFPSSFCCFSPLPAFPQFPSHLIPSFAAPPPDSATAPGPPVSSSGPLPQTAHDPLCCLRIHRVSLALFAVGRLYCWRVSFLFRAHRGGVESRQSLRESVSKKRIDGTV